MRHLAAITLLGCALSAPASAQLIAVDLLAPGDGLITRDTDTNLDWLDVPLTANQSYDQIQAGAGGWIAAGWRYATMAEVCNLWVTHGSVTNCNTLSAPFPSNPLPEAVNLITLLGSTENILGGGGTSTVRTSGLFDDASPVTNVGVGRIQVSTMIGSGLIVVSSTGLPNMAAANAPQPTLGSFLVRTTPPVVPALPLAASGALALLLAFATRMRTRGVA